MVNRQLFVKVIFGVVLAVLIVSFLNVGISLFYPTPKYSDFCEEQFFARPFNETEPNQEEITKQRECNDKFTEANEKRGRIVFFVLAPIGLILLITGTLVSSNLTIQIMLMGSGFASIVSGIIRNLEDKLSVFITIGILIIIGIVFTIKKLKD